MLTLWPLLLPVAAVSGWLLAQRKEQGVDTRPRALSRQYFVGLNYLLNEQPDKAVDVFIKLLEVDGDTVETHLALGSLFRRRGEVDRAIRIHQNLIARPQLSATQRIEALMSLGCDYMSAGVLDRAERIFSEVIDLGGQQRVQAMHHLLDIYTQEKAWEQAVNTSQQLQLADNSDMHKVIAHYYCELVEKAIGKQQIQVAQSYLKKAIAVDKNSVRASLLSGELEAMQGSYKSAIKAYKRIKFQDPDYLSEAILPMIAAYEQLANIEECIHYLQETIKEYPRISMVLVLAERIKDVQGVEAAADFVAQQLSVNPSVRGLNQLIQWHIDTTYGKVRDKLEVLKDITTKITADRPVYRCNQCGFAGKQLHWQCPGCKSWSTIKPIHGLEGD